MNKELLQKRFSAASDTYSEHATVQAHMAKELVDLSKMYLDNTSSMRMMELGCGMGLLTKQILNTYRVSHIVANDLVPSVQANIKSIVANYSKADFSFIPGDIETISFPNYQDVIWSGATIQWIKDLSTFFYEMGNCLTDKGFLILSSFGPNNYNEVKSITTHGINYPDVFEVMKLASQYFDVLDHKEWQEQMFFNSPVDVLKHMRYTGVNGTAQCKWTKWHLQNFITKYEAFKHESSYPLTYHPYLLVLQKKSN